MLGIFICDEVEANRKLRNIRWDKGGWGDVSIDLHQLAQRVGQLGPWVRSLIGEPTHWGCGPCRAAPYKGGGGHEEQYPVSPTRPTSLPTDQGELWATGSAAATAAGRHCASPRTSTALHSDDELHLHWRAHPLLPNPTVNMSFSSPLSLSVNLYNTMFYLKCQVNTHRSTPSWSSGSNIL
jgi:hypothetical protein